MDLQSCYFEAYVIYAHFTPLYDKQGGVPVSVQSIYKQGEGPLTIPIFKYNFLFNKNGNNILNKGRIEGKGERGGRRRKKGEKKKTSGREKVDKK